MSQFGYDEIGNVTTVTQSNLAAGTSSSTSFDYDMFGDLVETTDADGNVREIEYNDVAVPDPDNADALTRPTYEYAYDERRGT